MRKRRIALFDLRWLQARRYAAAAAVHWLWHLRWQSPVIGNLALLGCVLRFSPRSLRVACYLCVARRKLCKLIIILTIRIWTTVVYFMI